MITKYINSKYLTLFVLVVALTAVLALGSQSWAFPGAPTSSSDHASAAEPRPALQPGVSSRPSDPGPDQERSREAEVPVSVDALINPPPKDDRIFRVGPALKLEDADSDKGRSGDRKATDNGQELDLEISKAGDPQKREAGEDAPENKWTQMELDQDGTYIFFGESAEAEESLKATEKPKLTDYGVGIGKKWHF